MISSIVVGFDGSEAAERALRMGCELSQKFGSRIEVSHTPLDETVTFAAEAISGFYVGPSAAQEQLLREAAEEMGARAKAVAAKAGVPDIEVHIGHGDPVEAVLGRAKTANADLIVTGRRGLGSVTGLFLGSTSQSISKKAICACMTVP
ncbi:universal stress protein [Sulfitobacter sp. JB4-11]|uniref:universal stress protein n=1 Tax=Sulfitobacter rhodophyticola TaxID=3238304 RepID=UPI0035161F17